MIYGECSLPTLYEESVFMLIDVQDERNILSLIKEKSQSKEIIVIKPGCLEKDTEFIRLLFTTVPIYSHLVQHSSLRYSNMSITTVTRPDNDSDNWSRILQWDVLNRKDVMRSLLSAIYNVIYKGEENFEQRFYLIFNVNDEKNGCFLFEVSNCCKDGNTEVSDKAKRHLFPICKDKNDYVKYGSRWEQIKTQMIVAAKEYYSQENNMEAILKNQFEKMIAACNDISNEMIENNERIYNINITKDEVIYQFPSVELIEKYVSEYYEIAKLCFKEYKLFSFSSEARKILYSILNFGIMGDRADSSSSEDFWLLSPYALNSMRNVYERSDALITEFHKFYSGNKYDDLLFKTIEHDFIESVLADFKRWTYIGDKNSLVAFDRDYNVLKNYECEVLSSIAFVNVIRFCEKIVEFLLQPSLINKLRDDASKIEICIIGYIARKSELKYLKKSVDAQVMSSLKSALEIKKDKIRYTVYRNEKKQYSPIENDLDEIQILDIDYNKLFNLDCLRETVIKHYDMIFFVDCPNLYYDEFATHLLGPWEDIYNTLSNNDYKSNYYLTKCGEKLEGKCILNDIDNQLCYLSNRNVAGYGQFKPAIKEYLFDSIQKTVNEYDAKEFPKTVYCFLSSIESKITEKYKKSTVVHKETYNHKELYVVKFSNCDKNVIEKSDGKSESICFSLWNLFKNVSIRQADAILGKYITTKQKYSDLPHYWLNNIGIRLSWDTSMENYIFEWGLNPEAFGNNSENVDIPMEDIEHYIKEILSIALGIGNNKNMIWYQSVKDAVCNIILGRASTCGRMLQYYLVKNGKSKAKTIKSRKPDENEILQIIKKNRISPSSDKKLYYDVMAVYDQYAVSSLQKAAISKQVLDNGGNIDVILQNILAACKDYDYENSNLYINIGG